MAREVAREVAKELPGGTFLSESYNYVVGSYHAKSGEYHYFVGLTKAGERAPDFTLPSLDGGEVSLSSLRGKPVVIEFGNIT